MSKVIPLYQPGKTRSENETFAKDIFERFTIHFYRCYSYQGQFLPIVGKNNPITTRLQLSGGDVCIISPTTKEPAYVEEKADAHQPINCFLERYSNTVKIPPIDGWMKTSEATYLLYSFYWLPKEIEKEVLDVFLWDMKKLQAWFWPKEREWAFGKMYIMPGTQNQTGGYLVHLHDIVKDIPTKRYLIMSIDEKDAIIKQVNAATSPDEIKAIAFALSSDRSETA